MQGHSHANPAHAQYCYLCTQKSVVVDVGEGDGGMVDEEVSYDRVVMEGFLLKDVFDKDSVTRAPADFTVNNTMASQLECLVDDALGKTATIEAINENVKGILADFDDSENWIACSKGFRLSEAQEEFVKTEVSRFNDLVIPQNDDIPTATQPEQLNEVTDFASADLDEDVGEETSLGFAETLVPSPKLGLLIRPVKLSVSASSPDYPPISIDADVVRCTSSNSEELPELIAPGNVIEASIPFVSRSCLDIGDSEPPAKWSTKMDEFKKKSECNDFTLQRPLLKVEEVVEVKPSVEPQRIPVPLLELVDEDDRIVSTYAPERLKVDEQVNSIRRPEPLVAPRVAKSPWLREGVMEDAVDSVAPLDRGERRPRVNKAYRILKPVAVVPSKASNEGVELTQGDGYVKVIPYDIANVHDRQYLKRNVGELIVPDTPAVVNPPDIQEAKPLSNATPASQKESYYRLVRHNRFEELKEALRLDPSLVDIVDLIGNTLLHVAAQNNNKRISGMLIKADIDIDKKNAAGNTAIDIASAMRFNDLAEYLAQLSAKN